MGRIIIKTAPDRDHLVALLRDATGLDDDWHDLCDVAGPHALADAILAAGYRLYPGLQLTPADAAQIHRATLTLRTTADCLDLLTGDTR